MKAIIIAVFTQTSALEPSTQPWTDMRNKIVKLTTIMELVAICRGSIRYRSHANMT